ncbi:hypothetical protein HY522_00365 [bacterium]|nr:hypothetical protein [bacterium]
MNIQNVTLSDISQRYYAFAQQMNPSALPDPGSIKVEPSQDSGSGTLVDTYV